MTIKQCLEWTKSNQKSALHSLYHKLNEEQIDVVILIYAGFKHHEIANHLNISERQFRRKFKIIKKKLLSDVLKVPQSEVTI